MQLSVQPVLETFLGNRGQSGIPRLKRRVVDTLTCRNCPLFRSVLSVLISGKTCFSSIAIELMVAYPAATHPLVPGRSFLGKSREHKRCRPHIELSARPRRCNVLFR